MNPQAKLLFAGLLLIVALLFFFFGQSLIGYDEETEAPGATPSAIVQLLLA